MFGNVIDKMASTNLDVGNMVTLILMTSLPNLLGGTINTVLNKIVTGIGFLCDEIYKLFVKSTKTKYNRYVTKGSTKG